MKFDMNKSDFAYFYFSVRCEKLMKNSSRKIRKSEFVPDDMSGIYRKKNG